MWQFVWQTWKSGTLQAHRATCFMCRVCCCLSHAHLLQLMLCYAMLCSLMLMRSKYIYTHVCMCMCICQDDSSCSTKCGGDLTRTCGGELFNAVYEVKGTHEPIKHTVEGRPLLALVMIVKVRRATARDSNTRSSFCRCWHVTYQCGIHHSLCA